MLTSDNRGQAVGRNVTTIQCCVKSIRINKWWEEVSTCGMVQIYVYSLGLTGVMVFPIKWMIEELIKGDDIHMMITSTFAAVACSVTLILMMCAFCACVHRCENQEQCAADEIAPSEIIVSSERPVENTMTFVATITSVPRARSTPTAEELPTTSYMPRRQASSRPSAPIESRPSAPIESSRQLIGPQQICNICVDNACNYNWPNCGHSFCIECVEQHKKSSHQRGVTPKCPLCNQV